MSLKPDDLAQIILDSIDDDEPPTALYTLNIHEARMLAHAVLNVVQADARVGRVSDEAEIAASEAYAQGVGERPFSQRMRAAITAALPHLTADDIRNTDAAEEIRTEGWMQGWAAGRDLDGDEDAIPYLRNTSAGRELMAEGWDALIESMSASGEFHDVDLRTMQRLNPYRKDDA